MKTTITMSVAAKALASCASKASDIEAAYVSPTLYQQLSSKQLAEEATTVSSRAIAAAGVQDKKAIEDASRRKGCGITFQTEKPKKKA
ncbi:hypothetical protein RMR16_007995 [Agrobacterium sp. rho-13.3]|uniref:hypothetical protein n=1 Tax=Agrobacterium sp. rho-13.3 TaxID=3072980 RepID=UPI002A15BDEA|nr:hypothetical protein [Agrobacterium sp. rho-13.3]MDX8312074.1 hypothetical protein [Agrobacterium sp. rho-13.3]